MNNQIIIIGGGSSVNELPHQIWDILSDKFTIGCNYSYKDMIPTALCCLDGQFYTGHVNYNPEVNLWNKLNPAHREDMKKLPLIIAGNTPQALENPLNNTLFVKYHSHTWFREESILKGFYCHALTGQLALSLASYLLDFKGDIFLLGFDSNTSGKTHYYKHTKHRGIGYNDYYEGNDLNKIFKPYTKEAKLNIYNVSVDSKINIFKKITPETFLKSIEGNSNQTELRAYIRSKLT